MNAASNSAATTTWLNVTLFTPLKRPATIGELAALFNEEFGIGAQVDADSPAIRSALLRRLIDVDEDTRDEALAGLATRGDVRALPALLDALRAGVLSGVVSQAAVDLAHPDVLAALEALQADDTQAHSDLLAETILEVRQKLANSGG